MSWAARDGRNAYDVLLARIDEELARAEAIAHAEAGPSLLELDELLKEATATCPVCASFGPRCCKAHRAAVR